MLPTIYEASISFYKLLYGFLRETLPTPLTANRQISLLHIKPHDHYKAATQNYQD